MPLPNEINLPLTDNGSVSMLLNRIPADRFFMGARGYYSDEQPAHEVSIPFDFYLGKYPVTQQQFAVWTESAAIEHTNHFPDKDAHPAENMSWHEAMHYCQWLSERYQLMGKKHEGWPDDYLCALPSEAQWEFGCSAWQEITVADDATQRHYTEYHTGDGLAAMHEAGWFEGNSDSNTQPVGQKQPNRHGLHDMHGNVDEWCADVWDKDAYRRRVGVAENPRLTGGDDAYRVFRGGSWSDPATDCRAAYRYRWLPGVRFRLRGFRVGLFPVHSRQNQQK